MPASNIHINTTDNPLDEQHFHKLKAGLTNSSGTAYTDFKKTLKPNYLVVWRDITIAWAGIISVVFISWILFRISNTVISLLLIIPAAAILGYIMAGLVNFFHEAAHHNLSGNKKLNDLSANLFIGILIGQGIKNYRVVHWQHHIALGTTADTERSYFESLNLRFFMLSLSGISAISFFIKRAAYVNGKQPEKASAVRPEKYFMLAAGLVFHALLLASFYLSGQYGLMAVWILATGSFYPFFNRLRQLIEHRSENASPDSDYSMTDHGKTNRLFGNSIIARTFGSAGFNRHLLHHLEPTVSYTRLNDLETFLKNTPLAENLEKQRSTYFSIFKKLIGR